MKNEEKKAIFRKQIQDKEPEVWFILIKQMVRGHALRVWIASIIAWHYGRGGAFNSVLGDLANELDGENKLTAKDQQTAFKALNLQWFPSKADDAKPHSYKMRGANYVK